MAGLTSQKVFLEKKICKEKRKDLFSAFKQVILYHLPAVIY